MTENKIFNAAFYGRYSAGPDQNENSIVGQRRECYAKAKSQNAVIRKEYIDRHISGQTDKRPAFLELMKDVKKGLYDIVYVYTIDRFSRNKYDIAKYKNDLRKAGTRLISAKEYIPAGPEGIILESVLEGMAEYYSKELSRKVSRGIYESALKYRHIGGVVPFGYELTKDKQYKLHPLNSHIVLEIFERYASGEYAVDICKDLNSRGILTSMKQQFKKNSLTRILQNPKYIGTYSYKRKFLNETTQREEIELVEFKNAIVPIVSEELFEKVGRRMEQNKHNQSKKAENTVEFLLSGKLYCGECEYPMTGDSGTSGQGVTYYYYTCANKKSKKGEKHCKSKSYPKEKLEMFIVDFTKREVLNDNFLEFISQMAEDLQNDNSYDVAMILLEKNLKDVENKIENILKAIEQGIFTETTKERLEHLEKTKKDIQYQIQLEQFKKDTPAISKDAFLYFLNQFKEGDMNNLTYRKAVIDTFINTIIINKETIIIAYNYSDRANGTHELQIKTTFDKFECGENGGR